MIHHNRSKPKPAHRMPTQPKPTLEIQRLPIFRVHYKALEAYVQKVFGFEFDFLFAARVTEGCAVDYDVLRRLPDTIAWDRKAADLRRGQRTKEVQLILGVLAADGYIPAGRYTVSTHKLPDPVAVYSDLLRRTGDPQAAECITYKTAHKGNKAFTERAAILDKAFVEAQA